MIPKRENVVILRGAERVDTLIMSRVLRRNSNATSPSGGTVGLFVLLLGQPMSRVERAA